MIYVNFNGRLGADAEVRTDKGGKQFVSMRIATDEFKNGVSNTVWLSVYDYTNKTQRMAASLKKGSLVNVHGVETVGTYTTSQGEFRISRDVASDRIDFISSGNRPQSDTTNHDDAQPNRTTREEHPVTCGVFTKPEVSALSSIPSDADDLPF